MTVQELNEILGRELGYAPFDLDGLKQPRFMWSWSELLFWPSARTGKTIEKRTPGGIIYMEPEYAQIRMCRNTHNSWLVTKWCAPEDLPDWNKNFPGADYPARGYRILTDWYNKPNVLPTYEDTQVLIHLLRQQLDSNETKVNNEYNEAEAKQKAAVTNALSDEIGDTMTAFLNPTPGKRGGSVSFPSLNKELIN